MNDKVVLEVRGIVKDFPGLRANDNISFQLHEGEILTLLGENGAGKTTLMNIIMGIYKPDAGEILVNGEPVHISDPREANRLGIGMVHQHFKLVHNFTVAENIVLGAEPGNGLKLNMKQAVRRVQELSERYGLAIDPNARTDKITVGMQQRTEILKMLYRDANILIFDEPTAVLMPQEIEDLIAIMRSLVARGKSIILITHKLKEIEQVADRCVIIRRGQLVDTVNVADTTTQEMADKMVGRVVHFNIDKQPQTPGECVLKVEHLSVKNEQNVLKVNDFSFDIHAGEIVGIAGVDGNGQTELVNAITGLGPVADGKITLCGQDITHASVSKRIAAGISHIPEDRQRRGLVLDFMLEENIVLGRCGSEPFSAHGVLKHDAMRAYADRIIEQYDVRCGEGARSKAGGLSGGNQQKCLIGKWLSIHPKVIIIDEPTRGIDVGAKSEIHNLLRNLAEEGIGVIVISSELPEVIGVSDRVAVIHEGHLSGVLEKDKITEENIMLLASGEQL